MTSSIDGTFYNFSVTRIVRMICAKNYEKLSKFVKVMAKILSVLFSGHGEGSEGKNVPAKCMADVAYPALRSSVQFF